VDFEDAVAVGSRDPVDVDFPGEADLLANVARAREAGSEGPLGSCRPVIVSRPSSNRIEFLALEAGDGGEDRVALVVSGLRFTSP